MLFKHHKSTSKILTKITLLIICIVKKHLLTETTRKNITEVAHVVYKRVVLRLKNQGTFLCQLINVSSKPKTVKLYSKSTTRVSLWTPLPKPSCCFYTYKNCSSPPAPPPQTHYNSKVSPGTAVVDRVVDIRY